MSRKELFGTVTLVALVAALIATFVIASDLKTEVASLRIDFMAMKTASEAPQRLARDIQRAPALIKGWAVRIFEAPRLRQAAEDVISQAYAGGFIHTASWISLADYKKHEGIFLSGDAAVNLRGLFQPMDQGRYVFAVHMEIVVDSDNNGDAAPLVSCYAHLTDGSGKQLINGKMLVDGNRPKGALISNVALEAGLSNAKAISLSFVCDGQRQFAAEKIMFRLCFRKAEDTNFQPLVPNLRV
jgi:hypothetical protein